MKDYEEVEWLGRGVFGEVLKVRRSSDGKLFACKVQMVTLDGRNKLENVEKEVQILKKLVHNNIVRYVDHEITLPTSQSRAVTKLGLIMEYCPQGSLQDFIDTFKRTQQRFMEKIVWQVLSQLSSALRYCHYGVNADTSLASNSWEAIIHRDIKPANVLVSAYSPDLMIVKLADFGLATAMNPEAPPETYAGTPVYLPPEIARSNSQGIRWRKSCDVFSLGVTIYIMCAYNDQGFPFPYRMEQDDSYTRLPPQWSDRLDNCVSRCLSWNPGHRHDTWDLVKIASDAVKLGIVRSLRNFNTVLNDKIKCEFDPLKIEHAEVLCELALEMKEKEKEKYSSAQAWRLYAQASTAFVQIYGALNSRIVDCQYEAAKVLYDVGWHSDAEHALAYIMELHLSIYGDKGRRTGQCLHLLGMTQYEEDKEAEAEESLQKALSIFDQNQGTDPVEKGRLLLLLGEVQCSLEKWDLGEQSITNAFTILTECVSRDDIKIFDCLLLLARTNYEQNRFHMAEELTQKALQIGEERVRQNKPRAYQDVAQCRFYLAIILVEQKQPEARKVFREALHDLENAYGPEDDRTKECMKELMEFDQAERRRASRKKSPNTTKPKASSSRGDNLHTSGQTPRDAPKSAVERVQPPKSQLTSAFRKLGI